MRRRGIHSTGCNRCWAYPEKRVLGKKRLCRYRKSSRRSLPNHAEACRGSKCPDVAKALIFWVAYARKFMVGRISGL